MRAPRFQLGLVAALAACGSSSPPPAPTASQIALAAPPARGDVEVARVNGRPVWGSCVTTQSAGRTREIAIQECVDFELLAQAAEARGLASDPGVGDALRTALVNRLVETGFEDRFQKPADLGAVIEQAVDANVGMLHVPELRASAYLRVVIDRAAPADRDARAKAIAEQIAARVTGETGLFPVTLADAAAPFRAEVTAAGLTIEQTDVPRRPAATLAKPYADALFAIPEVGRAVGPVRTQWGWDIILWTGRVPARDASRSDLADDIFPDLRRAHFLTWAQEIQRSLEVHVEYIDANVAKLDQGSAR